MLLDKKTLRLFLSWIEVDPILLYITKISFGTYFKFNSDLLFKSNKIKFFPSSYKESILN